MSEQTAKAGKLSGKLQEAYKNIETRFTERFLEEDGSLKVGNTGKKVVSAYRSGWIRKSGGHCGEPL